MATVRSLTALLPAAVLFGSIAGAADLKIATIAPEGSAWMKDMRVSAQEVRDRTGGRVNIKLYGGGIQGTDKRVLRKIRIGQLQGGVFSSNGLVERFADIGLYGLPLLFASQDEVDYVRQRLDSLLAAGLEEAGFVSFGFAGGGFAYLMSNKPVTRLADLKGQKVWVPEGDRASFAAMQALSLSPVVLPVTDVLTGLETGLLDIVATPPVGAIVLQWYTKTRFLTTEPLSYTVGLLALDRQVFAGLSPQDQAVLREVMTRLYARFDAQSRQDNAGAEVALRANGISFVPADPAEVPRWRAAVADAMDRLAAEGAVSPARLAEVRRLIAEYRAGPTAASARAGAPTPGP